MEMIKTVSQFPLEARNTKEKEEGSVTKLKYFV
jgi:hypothetical protein